MTRTRWGSRSAARGVVDDAISGPKTKDDVVGAEATLDDTWEVGE